MAQLTPSLTWLMIGLVLVSGFAGLFSIGIAQMAESYQVTPANLTAFDKMNELQAQTEIIKDDLTKVKEKEGALDVLGSWFTNGYTAVIKIPVTTVSVLFGFIDDSLALFNIGPAGVVLKSTIVAIIILLIFMGILLTILIKAGYIL